MLDEAYLEVARAAYEPHVSIPEATAYDRHSLEALFSNTFYYLRYPVGVVVGIATLEALQTGTISSEEYVESLQLGSSTSAQEILAQAGLDLEDKSTFERVFTRIKRLLEMLDDGIDIGIDIGGIDIGHPPK